MNQTVTIERVIKAIRSAMADGVCQDPARTEALLQDVLSELHAFLADGIDFKAVVNALDDSILITDAQGRVIYVNPSHQANTGIDPAQLLGRRVQDIVEEGKLFTGGAVCDVLKTGKKAFRLAEVQVTDPPETGYVIGVPLFDENGNLTHVIATSRPIFTLKALQQDFDQFLAQANALRQTEPSATIMTSADMENQPSSRLVGNSPALKAVWTSIQKAAPTDATVLITGESGVGKEIVADELYRLSRRRDKPFIKVNCASIPVNLLESELFGYEKGAFSGASANGKRGLFEMANGGTLLLDEIGDMPMDLQVKLLRAIQNQEITRVGGTRTIPLNIRFIAATNSDLKQKISEGTFRRDLYYRLNVVPIHVPPLREHREDIRLLCEHFLAIYGKKHGRPLRLTDQHYDILIAYDWPGNIRELENVIEYLTICATGNTVDENLLRGVLDIAPDGSGSATPSGTLSESMANYEKALIENVLKSSRSLRDAGAKLGVNASTISRKIRQYDIDYPGAH